MTKNAPIKLTLARLRRSYKKTADTFIQWSNPLELVIGVVLSAQCTDRRVNEVTKTLFKKYTSANGQLLVNNSLRHHIYFAFLNVSKHLL